MIPTIESGDGLDFGPDFSKQYVPDRTHFAGEGCEQQSQFALVAGEAEQHPETLA